MRLDLTDGQLLLLRGLVATATDQERERLGRMQARPRGTHKASTIAEAERLARDFAELETLLAKASA